jgi:hypothetical protein
MDNSTNNISEKLVQYLDNELTGSEKESLEQQIAVDNKLKEELENLKATREAVKIFGLQERVAGVHQHMMKELSAPVKKISSARRIIRFSVAIAASVVLIAGSIIAYNFYNLSSGKIFASNYQPYELSTVRDIDSIQISPVEKAYREKKYSEVTGIIYDRPFTVKESFLRGISYIELKDNTKAIEELKKVIAENEKANSNLFKDEAEYYLALTYIRNKDYDFALDLLRSIQGDPGHIYHKKITGKMIRQVRMLKWR